MVRMLICILDKKAAKNLQELTSRFYTLIPHDFGRQRPPIISTLENVREKMDMLMVRKYYHEITGDRSKILRRGGTSIQYCQNV